MKIREDRAGKPMALNDSLDDHVIHAANSTA